MFLFKPWVWVVAVYMCVHLGSVHVSVYKEVFSITSPDKHSAAPVTLSPTVSTHRHRDGSEQCAERGRAHRRVWSGDVCTAAVLWPLSHPEGCFEVSGADRRLCLRPWSQFHSLQQTRVRFEVRK